MKIIYSATLLFLLLSCGSVKQVQTLSPGGDRYVLTQVSTDESYGYTEDNPVKVGGVKNGPANERRYLNSLTGPNGEALDYKRLGSCCPFKTPNGFAGNGGLLDKYEIKYEGLDKPIIIYINMYDKDVLRAPKGLRIKN